MDEDEKLVKAVEKSQEGGGSLITLSTGVVLKARQANPMVLIRVMSAFPRPEPPVYFNKAMNREMTNPDDPDYIERVKAWETQNNSRILNALIMLGTELHSKPKGMPGPQDDGWMEDLDALELPTKPDNKGWRYMTWVLSKAAVNEKDLEAIRLIVGRTSGVAEEDVADAESFPGSD